MKPFPEDLMEKNPGILMTIRWLTMWLAYYTVLDFKRGFKAIS